MEHNKHKQDLFDTQRIILQEAITLLRQAGKSDFADLISSTLSGIEKKEGSQKSFITSVAAQQNLINECLKLCKDDPTLLHITAHINRVWPQKGRRNSIH